MSHPLVSVVILSYNRPELLRRALASVVAQTHPNLEIILVDNPSPKSEEIASVATLYPACKLYRQADNLGFTGGMNFGIDTATGDYVLLTEDDIELDNDCVQKWIKAAEGRDKALFSGLIVENTTGETNFAGGSIYVGGGFDLKIWNSSRAQELYETEYLTGSLIFANRAVWKHLKGFHPDFFMYMEDVELSVRANREGYRLYVDPSTKAHHLGGKTGFNNRSVEVHKLKNVILLYRLHGTFWATCGMWFRFAVGLRHARREDLTRIAEAIKWNFSRSIKSKPTA